MTKISFGNKNCFYPTPTILVGVTVDGKPNYLNVSYAGIANRSPAMVFISLNKLHYSTGGVKENKSFSINIPSTKMLAETDYCGLVSGKDVDKSKLFHTFYGTSNNIPMIEECPINMACQVVQEFELEGSNVLFVGKILESFSEEKYLSNDLPDIKKIDPILLSLNDFNYYNVGTRIEKAWSIGKKAANSLQCGPKPQKSLFSFSLTASPLFADIRKGTPILEVPQKAFHHQLYFYTSVE